ncbi:hypothetical protein SNOG_07817 [Parastagonospora nodorum SN15]|uniref:Uncharacterized protein n=1 Tax=Phaeosphaeria nodorum (strain SN15 / ATCC MYA-4574 / FGSC 10173) TaxID=321614 RepID=Q0UK97_PHANO|nr:hypothetical protein SNOG_07817 [Parastagonospora nodorum SN15]EAT85283.1 hypothetical protein SNOG_07817 [Parastagonospora nodorum SN15]
MLHNASSKNETTHQAADASDLATMHFVYYQMALQEADTLRMGVTRTGRLENARADM